MFYYLLTPADQAPTLLGLTVINDTITEYSTIYGYALDKCLDKYEKTTTVRYVRFDDNDHSNYHSKNKNEASTEITIEHSHIKHQQTLTPLQLNRFLKKMSSCFEIEFKPGDLFPSKGKPFLTKKIRKDIIKKFMEYQKNNYTEYKSSNSMKYNTAKNMPSLGKHAACIRMGLTQGCNVVSNLPSTLLTPNNTYGMEPLTLPAPKNTDFNTSTLGSIAGTGLLLYSILNCFKKSKSQSKQNKPTVSLKLDFQSTQNKPTVFQKIDFQSTQNKPTVSPKLDFQSTQNKPTVSPKLDFQSKQNAPTVSRKFGF